eukprot:4876532-Prymnesium_polylepis.2
MYGELRLRPGLVVSVNTTTTCMWATAARVTYGIRYVATPPSFLVPQCTFRASVHMGTVPQCTWIFWCLCALGRLVPLCTSRASVHFFSCLCAP